MSLTKNLIVFFTLLAVGGCTPKARDKSEQSHDATTESLEGKPSKDKIRQWVKDDPGPAPQTHNKELAELEKILGPADRSKDVAVNSGLLEYQVEIKNYIKDDSPFYSVKELEWTIPKKGDQPGVTLFVWFKHEDKKMISFHSLIHEEGWEF